jgi:hypothetical protein
MDETLYWAKLSAIGQIAGALATFSAVVVTLYLTRVERRIRIKVSAKLGRIATQEGATPVLSISVENVGLRKARIEGLYWMGGIPRWRVPRPIRWFIPKWLDQESAFQVPEYDWHINQNFPWRLEPGESQSTHFHRQGYFEDFTEQMGDVLFRKIPFLNKSIAVFPRVGMGVATQRISLHRIDNAVLLEMRKAWDAKKADALS